MSLPTPQTPRDAALLHAFFQGAGAPGVRFGLPPTKEPPRPGEPATLAQWIDACRDALTTWWSDADVSTAIAEVLVSVDVQATRRGLGTTHVMERVQLSWSSNPLAAEPSGPYAEAAGGSEDAAPPALHVTASATYVPALPNAGFPGIGRSAAQSDRFELDDADQFRLWPLAQRLVENLNELGARMRQLSSLVYLGADELGQLDMGLDPVHDSATLYLHGPGSEAWAAVEVPLGLADNYAERGL